MKMKFEEDGTLVIDKKLLQAVLEFASADASRPQCNQLRVRGNKLLATDGHSLIVVTVGEHRDDIDYGVDSNWLRKELKSSTMKLVGLKEKSKQVELTRLDPKTENKIATIVSDRCDETFPPVFEVLPDKLPFETPVGAGLYLDPALFKRLDKLVEAMGSKGVRIQRPEEPLHPVRFDTGYQDLVAEGALMPMRGTTNDGEIDG